MAYENISSVRQTFIDGNIDRSDPNIRYNSSVAVIGVATKGPVNIPVLIERKDDIESIFGSYNSSTLALKLKEAWESTVPGHGARRIYGVRLGGGLYAEMQIPEMSRTGTSADYDYPVEDYALKLTAKYPGYLPVTVKRDIVNGLSAVVVYNPDTEVETVISYNTTDLDDTAVDVHTASELVDAINSDPNLNSIVTAELPELEAVYELKVSDTGTYADGYTTENGYPVLTLTDLGSDGANIEYSNNLFTGYPKNAPNSAKNLLRDVSRVYELSTVTQQLIDGTGGRRFKLTKAAITDPDYSDINKIVDIDGSYKWPTATPQAEYRQIVRGRLMGSIIQTTSLEFTTSLYLAPDVYDATNNIDTAWATAQADGDYYGSIAGYAWADVARSNSADNLKDHIVLYYKREGSKIPIARTNYTVAWTHAGGADSATPTLTVDIDSSLVTDGTLQAGDEILIDVDSVTGILYEKANISQVNSSGNFYDYFISGRQIQFGGPLPTPIEISYAYVREYTIGNNVELSDEFYGEFKFIDKRYCLGSRGNAEIINLNGGTGYAVEDTHPIEAEGYYFDLIPQAGEMHAGVADTSNRLIHRDSQATTTSAAFNMDDTAHGGYVRVGLRYTYEPEWPDITEVTRTLEGGTSGINIPNDQKYEELETTLNSLRSYPTDIFVISGMYLDDLKESYNPITGIKENVNAEYHILFHEFIEFMNENERPCIGLMSVRNPSSYTTEGFNNWKRNLITYDPRDFTRAANVMTSFANEQAPTFFGVVAMPVIYTLKGADYVTTAESTVAGMYSSLPYDQGLNYKTLHGIRGVGYKITATDANEIAGMNFITYRYASPKGFVIASDPTVLGDSSAYNTLSTARAAIKVTAEVRELLQSFLGSNYEESIKNAMQQQVNRILQTNIQQKVLQDGEGAVRATPREQSIGLVNCALKLYPAWAIRSIHIPVELRLKPVG
jgi:hypothetical protein